MKLNVLKKIKGEISIFVLEILIAKIKTMKFNTKIVHVYISK